MRRLLSWILCLALMLSLSVPVMAAGPEIVFTSDSSFQAGGTVTVDKNRTLDSVYNYGSSDAYNAYLEGDVQYYWMRNDSYYADGPSITLTENDKGCQFYCIAALYSDADHTQQCATLYSATFSVPNTGNPALEPEEEEQYFLEIMQLPYKLEYISGEKLDLSGLWVRIYTPDGFIDSRNGQYLTYSQRELVTVGEQKIKLSYEDAMEVFIVTVKQAPSKETEPPETDPAQTEPVTTEPAETDATQAPTAPSQEEEPSAGKDTEVKKPGKADKGNKNNQDTETTGASESLIPILIGVLVLVTVAVAVMVIVLLKKINKR